MAEQGSGQERAEAEPGSAAAPDDTARADAKNPAPEKAHGGDDKDASPRPERAEPSKGERDREAREAKIEETVLSRHAAVFHTTIYGVSAQNFAVGGAQAGCDYRPELLDEQEVSAALRYFHPPAPFDALRQRVRRENLVVLCGREGSGRRCAALKLLDEVRWFDADDVTAIERLSPGTPLAVVREHPFRPRGCYLLADHHEEIDERQSCFEIERLQSRLRSVGAFMVVTTEASTTAIGRSAVTWRPTTAADAFSAHITATDFDWTPEQAEAVARAVARLPLSRMAEFIADLRQHGPEAACASSGETARADFRAWLRDHPPHVHDLAPVVVAALVPNASERDHETRSVDLAVEIDKRARRDSTTAEYTTTVRPSRGSRTSALVRRADPSRPGSHVVVVNPALTAEAVLDELHERYGDELWAPIRTWLHDVPVGAGMQLPRLLAAGMAGLARLDLGVADHVMDTWADDHDDDRRWAAALANSVLCRDRQTAESALPRAIRWSLGSQRTKITATHAFGLDLSLHLPTQAVCRLWNLTFGDVVVAWYARAGLVAVLHRAMLTRRRLSHILALVVHQFDHLITTVSPHDSRVDRALATLTRLLAVRIADDVPMTVAVLRADPDNAVGLGHLWAGVIQSWQHRVVALDELHAACSSLDAPAAAALGEVIHHELSPTQWRWLCRDLGIDIRARKGTMEVMR